MTTFNLSELTHQLKDTQSSGVSFAKKSLKLDSAEDATEVIKAIQKCQKLEYLDLEGNTLGPDAAKAVAEVLKTKGSDLKRALWKDMFTGRSKEEIPKALKYFGDGLCFANTHLIELDLSDNAFGPIALQSFGTFLASSTCYTLRELRLNNNGLGITGGKMLARALLTCYENSSKDGGQPLALKTFIAGRNRLENEGTEALASVFKKLTSLEEVSMPQNGIYHQGITALASGLSANRGLRILNLNDNTVGLKGAMALASALPNFRNLEQLNLGDCLLKTKGSLVLAEALGIKGNHCSLTELDLSYNEIGIRGANPIAEAMADKTLLVNLQLKGNHFGTKGWASLCQSLRNSQRIDSLAELSGDENDENEKENDNDEDENEEDEEDLEEEEEEEEEDEDEDDDDDNDDDDNEDEDEEHSENEESDENEPIVEYSMPLTKVTVEDFLKAPTGEKLLLLQNDNVQAFIEHARNTTKGTDISSKHKFTEEFIRIIMKVSQLCESGYPNIRLKAENLTDTLYAKLFSFALENNQISTLNNALLINLDLIKSEDKHRKIDWNLEGCFKALEKVSQREYFLAQTRDTLKLFLEKPAKINRAKVVDTFQDSKASLRGVLDRIQAT